jgi:hypothetical protein
MLAGMMNDHAHHIAPLSLPGHSALVERPAAAIEEWERAAGQLVRIGRAVWSFNRRLPDLNASLAAAGIARRVRPLDGTVALMGLDALVGSADAVRLRGSCSDGAR